MNFIDYSVEYYRFKGPSTRGVYHSVVLHLANMVGSSDLPIEIINASFCERFRDYLLTQVSPNSAAHYFSKFKSILNRAVDDNFLQRNPAKRIRVRTSETLPKFLTIEEVEVLAKTNCRNDHVKYAFLFSVFTGLRYGDVETLRWDQIGETHVSVIEHKTGRAHLVPLATTAHKIIELMKTLPVSKRLPNLPATLVFKLPVRQEVRIAVRDWGESGIDRGITFHWARHTFATLALNGGVGITTVQRLLGHRSINNTLIYAKDQRPSSNVTPKYFN